jgi:hypothetical protein
MTKRTTCHSERPPAKAMRRTGNEVKPACCRQETNLNMQPIIKIENLSKMYRLSAEAKRRRIAYNCQLTSQAGNKTCYATNN